MDLRSYLLEGQAIPAQPLALDVRRRFSERHQRAITRYYLDAGVGGLAVGVHSTQFEIREPKHGLFQPVLELASIEVDESLRKNPRPFIKIAGVCGLTDQALQEVELARSYGYQAALLSLAAWKNADDKTIMEHCRRVAETMPVIGFYLQPAVGGRIFSYAFWREFSEIQNVFAIKIAPFNRYQTLDVMRAVIESGRDDIALYTGNDDSILTDLLTPFVFEHRSKPATRRIVGGLLGHWGVWTKRAVEVFHELKMIRYQDAIPHKWLSMTSAITDMNAAVFDPAHSFSGCIPGILEVLRRQGLVTTNNCLNPQECLSTGQSEELTRVCRAYPELTDDDFISENLDRWLS